jgi:hypothetical protein
LDIADLTPLQGPYEASANKSSFVVGNESFLSLQQTTKNSKLHTLKAVEKEFHVNSRCSVYHLWWATVVSIDTLGPSGYIFVIVAPPMKCFGVSTILPLPSSSLYIYYM